MKNPIKRRTVLGGITTVGATSIASGIVSAKDSYPEIDHDYTEHTVANMAVELTNDPQIAEDDKHDRIALSTTLFDGVFELYLAEGVESANEVPENIYKITTNTKSGVLDLKWKKGNDLEYWRDGNMYSLKIPPSNKIFEADKIDQKPMPDALEQDQGGNE